MSWKVFNRCNVYMLVLTFLYIHLSFLSLLYFYL